ncbi:MAG: tetratricopeptide repeat protein, partial [Planctomycetaceae bacterium]
SLEQMRLDRLTPPTDVRAINPDVSVAVSSIVDKCLHPNPNNRYDSAAKLVEDLNCELQWKPLKFAQNASRQELFDKWRKRHPRLLSRTSLAVLLGLTMLATGAGWKLQDTRLRTARAEHAARDFRDAVPEVRTLLTTPDATGPGIEEGIAAALESVAVFQSANDDSSKEPAWHWTSAYDALDEERQQEIRRNVFEVCYLVSAARGNQAQHSDAPDSAKFLNDALRFNTRAGEALSSSGMQREALLQKAALLELSGELDLAKEAWNSAATLNSDEFDSLVTGIRHLSDGHHADAVASLETAVMQHPHDYSGWFLLGKAFAGERRSDRAEGCFTTCVVLNPDCWRAWQDRGILRLSQQNFAEAERDFDRLIELRPDIAAAYLNRGLARHGLGRIAEAIQDLSVAIERGGPSRAWFLRSRFRQLTGDSAGAAEDFRIGLTTTPEDELSWIARGVARIRTDSEGALSDFQTALRYDNNSPAALQNMAHVYSQKPDQQQQAIEALGRVIAFFPDDAAAVAGRGVLLARAGRTEDAERDAVTLLSLHPSPLETYQAACIYALIGKEHPEHVNRAVSLTAEALRRQPDLLNITATDPDIENIRDSTQFQQIVNAIRVLSIQEK